MIWIYINLCEESWLIMTKVYKLVLKVLGYKLIWCDRYFILSRSYRDRKFVIWYIDQSRFIHIYKTCDTSYEAKFNWFILMKRKEGKYVTN